MNQLIAVLGRSAQLGDLYDGRSHNFLPGSRLWSEEKTKLMTNSRMDVTERKIVATPNPELSSKMEHLSINKPTVLDVLCDRFRIEGSSRYLLDSRKSLNSCVCALVDCRVTELRELSLDCPVEHREYLTNGVGTHVVTGIKYGSRAILVFEREIPPDQSREQVAKELDASVGKFKEELLKHPAQRMKAESFEHSSFKSVKCHYYGDYFLESPPQNLSAAFHCIQQFSSQNAHRPLEAYLKPLSHLLNKAEPLPIDAAAVSCHLDSACDYMLELHETICSAGRWLAALTDTPLQPQIEKLRLTQNLLERHKTKVSQALVQVRQKDQGAKEEECEIKAVLRSVQTSPFSGKLLQQWRRDMDRQCNILLACKASLSNCNINWLRELHELDQLAIRNNGSLLVELKISSDACILEALNNYVDSSERCTYTLTGESWLDGSWHMSFTEDFEKIKNFLEQNRNLGCAVIALPSKKSGKIEVSIKQRPRYPQNNLSASICCLSEVYKTDTIGAATQWESLELPLPVEGIRLTIVTDDMVELAWHHAKQALSTFKLHVYDNLNRLIRTEESSSCSASVRGLSSNTEYSARVSYSTAIGQSALSEPFHFKTRPMVCEIL